MMTWQMMTCPNASTRAKVEKYTTNISDNDMVTWSHGDIMAEAVFTTQRWRVGTVCVLCATPPHVRAEEKRGVDPLAARAHARHRHLAGTAGTAGTAGIAGIAGTAAAEAAADAASL